MQNYSSRVKHSNLAFCISFLISEHWLPGPESGGRRVGIFIGMMHHGEFAGFLFFFPGSFSRSFSRAPYTHFFAISSDLTLRLFLVNHPSANKGLKGGIDWLLQRWGWVFNPHSPNRLKETQESPL